MNKHLIFALAFSLPSTAMSAEVWLAGDPIIQQQAGQSYDYQGMFNPSAPWRAASLVVRIFKVSTQWILTASDSALTQMFTDLKRRGIGLAIEALMIPQTSSCGSGVEGYSAPGTMKLVADRVKRLGGDLQAIAMDEPLTFGHLYTGPNACQTSITDLANAIAVNAAAVRTVFPAVRIGDIEELGANTPLDQVVQFASAYQTATNSKLDFIHIDTDWAVPSWLTNLQSFINAVRGTGIKVGIIYDGNDAQTDLGWTQQTEQRFTIIEANEAMTPDEAVIQTWQLHPTHMLPETQPGTMTYLVMRYAAAPTSIALQVTGSMGAYRLTGTLTTEGNLPVPSAPIQVTATDTSANGIPGTASISGTVPANAASATWAMRINTECGGCSGPANVTIGTMVYKDTAQTATRSFPHSNYVAVSGQVWAPNSTPFSVTAGQPFTLTVPVHITYASRSSGYLTLIWLAASGQGISRQKWQFQSAVVPVGQVTTDANGEIVINPA